MMKKQEGILKAADNIGSAVGLTVCIAIVRIFMNPEMQDGAMRDIIVNYSGNVFVFVACFVVLYGSLLGLPSMYL